MSLERWVVRWTILGFICVVWVESRVDATKKQRYFVGVKTVNLTLDEGLWKRARVEAARRDVSVSALMREALGGLLNGSQHRESEETQRNCLVDLLEECQIDLTERPTREGTYAGRRFH